MDTPTAARHPASTSAPPDTAPGETGPDSVAPDSVAPDSVVEEAAVETSPRRPTEGDVELLSFAQRFELTARDLYSAAIEAGAAEGEYRGVFYTLRGNHEEYANAISALLGVDAPRRRDDARYDEMLPGFDTDDVAAVAEAAYDLESVAVVTHVDLVSRLEGTDGAKVLSSLLMIEAQHCTVLADVAGNGDDLDALLDNDAESVAADATPSGGAPETTEG